MLFARIVPTLLKKMANNGNGKPPKPKPIYDITLIIDTSMYMGLAT